MLDAALRFIHRVRRLEPSGVESVVRGRLSRLPNAGPGLRVGRHVQFIGPKERFCFGASVSLLGNTYLNATGDQGYLDIGEQTHVDQFCVFYGQGGLRLGARCAIASGVIIYTQSNQYSSAPLMPVVDQPVIYAPVTVGDDVWMGAGSIILPGVRVGDHAVVAAGAVVTSDVADWAIVAGVPARKVRDRRSEK